VQHLQDGKACHCQPGKISGRESEGKAKRGEILQVRAKFAFPIMLFRKILRLSESF
jgi:hypothetical protein